MRWLACLSSRTPGIEGSRRFADAYSPAGLGKPRQTTAWVRRGGMTRRREEDQSIPEAQPLQPGRHNWPFGGRLVRSAKLAF